MHLRYATSYKRKFLKMEAHKHHKTIILDIDETLIHGYEVHISKYYENFSDKSYVLIDCVDEYG